MDSWEDWEMETGLQVSACLLTDEYSYEYRLVLCRGDDEFLALPFVYDDEDVAKDALDDFNKFLREKQVTIDWKRKGGE